MIRAASQRRELPSATPLPTTQISLAVMVAVVEKAMHLMIKPLMLGITPQKPAKASSIPNSHRNARPLPISPSFAYVLWLQHEHPDVKIYKNSQTFLFRLFVEKIIFFFAIPQICLLKCFTVRSVGGNNEHHLIELEAEIPKFAKPRFTY